ncbi:MAG: carbohydrate kinase [Asticcacaulis sp.]|nr:carbohydrate kinase [Asticcacaulis sp.]
MAGRRDQYAHNGRNCAVLDVGKSFAKLSVVAPGGAILAERRIATPHLKTATFDAIDTEAIFAWLLRQLAAFADLDIDRIIPVAHGAACAFLDDDGRLVAPIEDYEFAIPEPFAGDYARIRPAFEETLSPALPRGLNLGAQIHWFSRRDPEAFARVRHILTYPQYWAWRLSGAITCEVTSLGCHSDLWSPREGRFSSLARNEGWAERFGPVRAAWETAGTLSDAVAQATGLRPDTRVHVGVHDSNAALAALLSGWPADREPPALLSTGTWFIAMAPGGSLDGLQAGRDCLGAVDVFGRPLPCARFMGGRAFEIITGGTAAMAGGHLDVDAHTLSDVMHDAALALPSFLDAGGPYPGLRGEIRGLKNDTPQTRAALGLLYQALLSTTCLDMIQSGRDLLIEGMAARNPLLCGLIAALHDGPVYCNAATSAVTTGAAALARYGEALPPRVLHRRVKPLLVPDMQAYRRLWTSAVTEAVAA